MEIPASILVQQVPRGISGAMRRNTGYKRPFVARLFLREVALCSFAVIFFTSSLPAQQSRSTAGPPPGWPVTNSIPRHGDTVPDATLGSQPVDTARTGESCSLWAVVGAQGATVSAARLQVPGKAKDEYRKACGDLKGNKPSSAEEHLRKAVRDYPQYTDAWVLLGQVLAAAKRIEDARGACSQASSVDSDYAPAYLCLAEVSAQQQKWDQTLDLAEHALALDRVENVYGHFYSAMAEFHLSDLPAAERNALQTIDADRLHRVPQAHLLLAQIYGARHNLPDAAAQLRAYLKVAPNSPDSAGVRKSLAELEGQTPK
jgi:tetratricopeptide (TPR) repeat protein